MLNSDNILKQIHTDLQTDVLKPNNMSDISETNNIKSHNTHNSINSLNNLENLNIIKSQKYKLSELQSPQLRKQIYLLNL